jgi:hypothetical protein
MTLNEIRAYGKEYLLATHIAPVLGLHPQSIRDQAREDSSRLGFSVILAGTRIKIPRDAFLAYMKGDEVKGGETV